MAAIGSWVKDSVSYGAGAVKDGAVYGAGAAKAGVDMGVGGMSMAYKLTTGKTDLLVTENFIAPVLQKVLEDDDLMIDDSERAEIRELLAKKRIVLAANRLSPAYLDALTGPLLDLALAKAAVYELYKTVADDEVTDERVASWLAVNGFPVADVYLQNLREAKEKKEQYVPENADEKRIASIVSSAKMQLQRGGVKHIQAFKQHLLAQAEKTPEQQRGSITDVATTYTFSILSNAIDKLDKDERTRKTIERNLEHITGVIMHRLIVEAAVTTAPFIPAVALMAVCLRVMLSGADRAVKGVP